MKVQVLMVAMAALAALAACSQTDTVSKPVDQQGQNQVAAGNKSADQQDAELQKQAEQYNAAQKNAGDKVVCEMEAISGTRIKQKVCRTVSDMERDEQSAQRLIKETTPHTPKGTDGP